jgi:hypothetical protein
MKNEEEFEKELSLVIQNEALRKTIVKLEAKIEKLEKILKENDLLDESEIVIDITDSEFICVDQIKKLKLICEQGEILDVGQVKNLQTLYTILRTIKTGQEPKTEVNSKTKKANVADLFKIVNGSN